MKIGKEQNELTKVKKKNSKTQGYILLNDLNLCKVV